MSHTHAWVLVHCVFSTKERANLIPDPDELCRYITGVARASKVTLLAAGGTKNHLHLLIARPPVLTLSKAMQELKGNSSRWLRERGVPFARQEGYGAFSVSQSQKRVMAEYIGKQAEHHRKWNIRARVHDASAKIRRGPTMPAMCSADHMPSLRDWIAHSDADPALKRWA